MDDVFEMGATSVPTGKSVRNCYCCQKCAVLFYCQDFAKKDTIGGIPRLCSSSSIARTLRRRTPSAFVPAANATSRPPAPSTR